MHVFDGKNNWISFFHFPIFGYSPAIENQNDSQQAGIVAAIMTDRTPSPQNMATGDHVMQRGLDADNRPCVVK